MFLFIACSNNSTDIPENDRRSVLFDTIIPQYAKSFKILKSEEETKLIVLKPWQGAGDSIEYTLGGDSEIKIPVKRVVCLSSTHIAMIDALGEVKTIVGVSDTKYVYNSKLKGKPELGAETNLNTELIVAIKPDVVICYGVTATITQTINRLKDLGIPVIINADYLEKHPLGRAEWIKFIAELYGKQAYADSLFTVIKDSYLAQKNAVDSVIVKPKVLCGLPWQGVWYVPGGESYMATYIRDAGAQYLWDNDDGFESIPKSIEEVFHTAQSADLWININAANSRSDILKVESRIGDMQVFEKRIFNNNKRINLDGCNDYFESSVINPHLVLKDLIAIVHNKVMSDSLYYYQKIN